MFLSSEQFYVFLVCIAFGGASGLLYSFFVPLKIISNSIFRVLLDLVYFCLIAFIYLNFSHYLNFPSFRVYMALGVFLGMLMYKESFHIILAKILKRLYNIINTKIKKCISWLKILFSKKFCTKDKKKDGRVKG